MYATKEIECVLLYQIRLKGVYFQQAPTCLPELPRGALFYIFTYSTARPFADIMFPVVGYIRVACSLPSSARQFVRKLDQSGNLRILLYTFGLRLLASMPSRQSFLYCTVLNEATLSTTWFCLKLLATFSIFQQILSTMVKMRLNIK